ncbi:MAG: hypothetical protein ACD_66C00018G0001, partial [uncultured bacterium]
MPGYSYVKKTTIRWFFLCLMA